LGSFSKNAKNDRTICIFEDRLCCMGIGWYRLRGERADIPDRPRCVEKPASKTKPAGKKTTETTRLFAGMGHKHPERPHRARRRHGPPERAKGAGARSRAQGGKICAKRSQALVPAGLCRAPQQSPPGIRRCLSPRPFAGSELARWHIRP